MLSSEFLMELAEKVYAALSALEGTPRPVGLFGGADGLGLDSGGEISAPHVLAGFSMESGRICSFVETLLDLMEKKGLDEAALAETIGWSSEALSGFLADPCCCPLKEVVFAFGLALHLNEEEMRRLMDSAGYVLAEEEVCDIIVLHCLGKGVFDLGDVNEALKFFNLKPIVIRPFKARPGEKKGPA